MPELVTRPVSALPTGTALSRFISVLAASGGNLVQAKAMADDLHTTTPQVSRAFDFVLQGKAAVPSGTTQDATWAGALAEVGIAREAIQLLRGLSIVGALESRVRHVPFNTKVPRDVTTVTIGDWVVEGTPIPVAALAFDQVGPLALTKVAVIVAITQELAGAGTETALGTIRQSVLGGLAATLDTKFLDPAIAAAPGRPASITNGATMITSTGSTPAAISADLSAMLAALQTSGSPVWIMKPTTMAVVAGALGNASDLPRTLHALPVIASKTSPAQITLLDADTLLLADEGGFDVSVSRDAIVQMDSAPASPVTAATVMTSFWPTDTVGVRAMRWIHWLRTRTGSVVYMPVTY